MGSSLRSGPKTKRAAGLRLLVTGCAGCPHAAQQGRREGCDPGEACVRALSGRLIDRFFRRMPGLAADYLEDGYWERRAIAARHASVARLEPLLRDPDEVVRRVAAGRVPVEWLDGLTADRDREVRILVAERLAVDRLGWAAVDVDYRVRQVAAQRMPVAQLPRLAMDADREVRKIVARRLPPFALALLAADADAEVRREACARMLPAQAALMLADEDWTVRLAAAERAPREALQGRLRAEPEALVRERIAERCACSDHE